MEKKWRVNDKGQLEVLLGGVRWRKAVRGICLQCGKPFIAAHRTHKRYELEVSFCSVGCASRYRVAQQVIRKVTKHCVICRRPFLVGYGRRFRYTTCGREACQRQHRVNISRKIQSKLRAERKRLV